MMQTSLARRLRVLRAERGLTVRQAAKLTGLAKETVSDIERARRHPNDVTLAKLAEAYEISVEELFDLEDEPTGEAVLSGKGEPRSELGPSAEEGPAVKRRSTDEARLLYEARLLESIVERVTPEPSTREERLEDLREVAADNSAMAAALRGFSASKRSGTKRDLVVLADLALCAYVGAVYLSQKRVGMQGAAEDEEIARARQEVMRSANEISRVAGETAAAARTPGTVVGMSEYRARQVG